jgi:hypothetical protein
MKTKVLSAAIVFLTGVTGAYVIAVTRRITGESTTLGLDVVCAVWVSVVSLFAIGVSRFARAKIEDQKVIVHILSMMVPAILLIFWAWLNLSGRVISHEGMMATK